MRNLFLSILILLAAVALAIETPLLLEAQVVERVELGQPVTVHLTSGFVTTLVFPEAVEVVTLGDPKDIMVEVASNIVFMKPLEAKPLKTNLSVKTEGGIYGAFLESSAGRYHHQVLFLVPAPKEPEPKESEEKLKAKRKTLLGFLGTLRINGFNKKNKVLYEASGSKLVYIGRTGKYSLFRLYKLPADIIFKGSYRCFGDYVLYSDRTLFIEGKEVKL